MSMWLTHCSTKRDVPGSKLIITEYYLLVNYVYCNNKDKKHTTMFCKPNLTQSFKLAFMLSYIRT